MGRKLIHKNLVGAYVYAIYVDGIVRYIGKGRRYRMIDHMRFAREIIRRRAAGEKVRANRVYNKLAKAIVTGAEIKPLVIVCGLSDADAFERERLEIAAAPAGQLWNLKEGGAAGDPALMRALWADPDHRRRFSEAIGEGKRKPHFRESARQTAQKHWNDPEYRAEKIAQHKAFWADPKNRAERCLLLKKVWDDPVKTARKSALVKSQWSPERRAAQRVRTKALWADPEFKARTLAKLIAAKRTPENSALVSARMKQLWADPGFRQKQITLIRMAKRSDRPRQGGSVPAK